MIDLNNIGRYRENNRIEAKNAMGGLPHSIWETYSAFANTLGGIILLGVEEYPDKSLHVLDLPDPEQLVEEFWELVNSPRQASVNILSDENVQIETIDGRRMIAITVPRAQRLDRPVYVDGNPLTGTYRRNGEGDCRCTQEEVRSMLRDAGVRTLDMQLLEDLPLKVLDDDTLHRYRARMWDCRPGHAWALLEDEEFLYKVGAVGRGADGELHPTAAGLLMFGYEYEIVRAFPNYFLDYREEPGDWRLFSASGDWNGNLYDFYTRVEERIVRDLPEADPALCHAVQEALANCVMNADYHGTQGLVIVKSPDAITLANPGAFRIEVDKARTGGVSDPRNAVLVKMFNLVNVGRRTGSGIPGIYAVWKDHGWAQPAIREQFRPDRITIKLSFRRESPGRLRGSQAAPYREELADYLMEHVTATSAQLAEALNLSLRRTRQLLRAMLEEDVISVHGGGSYRRYQLKS